MLRQRWVTIAMDRLRSTLPQPLGGPESSRTLRLNLFDDVDLTAFLDRVERTATGYVWVGRLEGIEPSSVTIAVTNDVLAGTISSVDTTYVVGYAADDIHVVQEINRAAFPPELPPVTVPVGPAGTGPPDVLDEDGSQIDVLVVYTPAARAAKGGTSSIEALIDLGISETNQAYANSGAVQRVRLVRKEEIAYIESPDMSTDLSRLRSTSDGHMDSVHALRDTYGADLVQLIVNSSGACGIAYLLTTQESSFAPWGFGVTHYSCVSPNYTFGHELGHNMGLHHDLYVTGSSTGTYAYSRGYVNQAAFVSGASSSKRWRDVMAYNDQCVANGFSCTRILYFSSPNNAYTSDPMGNASTADGVRSLDNTRVTVANFRASIPATNLTINDVSTVEGDSGTKTQTFTVSLTQAVSSTVSVDYATSGETATAGGDYVSSSGSLSIPAGATDKTLTVTIKGDVSVEPSETFKVTLSNAFGGSITDAEGIGKIINDDFTDASLTGVVVKTAHINELRTLVNERRAMRGLDAFSFAGTLSAGSTIIQAIHISELRSALNAVYTAAGEPAPSYTDDPLTMGSIAVKAAHITEIRDKAVNAP